MVGKFAMAPLPTINASPFEFAPLRSFRRSAAARRLASERVESRLLLVAKRRVEVLQRGLHGPRRLQHCVDPLLHRLEPADRRPRDVLGTGVLAYTAGNIQYAACTV